MVSIDWLVLMTFFIALRVLGFLLMRIFYRLVSKKNIREISRTYDEVDLIALIEVFPDLQQLECKNALIQHQGDYNDTLHYLIKVNGRMLAKKQLGDLDTSASVICAKEKKQEEYFKELKNVINSPKEIIVKGPRLRNQVRGRLDEVSSLKAICQCGCNGKPMTNCAKGTVNYSLYRCCPARLLRKEKEKDRQRKIRKENALKNQKKREKDRKIKREKLRKEELIKKKEEWRERGRQGLAAQSPKEAKWRKLKTYMGKPCSKQHSGEREARNGECVSCRESARNLRNAMKRAIYPVELNDAEREEILKIYKTSKQMTRTTGIQHHVDHIKPLSKGGEHHPANLQILTAEENLKKGAKFVEK